MAEKKTDAKTDNLVTIRLFKDDHAYKDPLYVSVNMEEWRLERGIDLQVPDYVAACIRDSEDARVEESRYNDAHKMR